MNRRLLDLHRAAGDANLGQTLLRLAELAAQMHRENDALQQRGSNTQRPAESRDPSILSGRMRS